MLLLTVTRDREDQILPLTWGFVPTKSADNWFFFFSHFRHTFPSLRDKELKFTMISDQSKGLEPALVAEFPDITPTYCCYHLGENLMKFHPGGEVRDLFWKAVKA